MAFSWFGLALALHILGAIMWAGATLFMAIVVFPALRRRGAEAEDAFNEDIMRRGGFGRYFAPIGAITLLAGAYLYWKEGHLSAPFESTSTTLLTIGGLAGFAAALWTSILMAPKERRMREWLAAHPRPLSGADKTWFHEESQRIGKLVAMGAPLLFLAVLLMLLRPVVG